MRITTPLVFLICFSFVRVYAQRDESILLNALNQKTVEVKSFDETDTSEFSALKNDLADFKVIGLGEATHGTKEFYQYKTKLIKYLVRYQRLKILIFESDMVGVEKINDYVLGSESLTLEKAMSNYGLLEIYRTQEVVDLIQWLKAYNLKLPLDQKVKIAGMDANLPYHIATKLLQSKLLSSYIDDDLKKDLVDIKSMPERRNFGQNKKKYLMGVAMRLDDIVRSNFKTDSLEVYSHYVHLLIQSLRMINLNDIESNAMRDAHMAQNVFWLIDKITDNQTAANWGHNGHICADKWRGYKPTGKYLRNKLKDRYYALGFIVGEGYARLWHPSNGLPFHKAHLPAIQNVNQLEHLIKQLKHPNFFLSLDHAVDSKSLVSYFSKPILTRTLGAQIVLSERDILIPIRVAKSYNGILFFRETTNATEIGRWM